VYMPEVGTTHCTIVPVAGKVVVAVGAPVVGVALGTTVVGIDDGTLEVGDAVGAKVAANI